MWAVLGVTATEAATSPNRIIQYRGPMPLLPPGSIGRDITLKFELYRSPQGGAPFWTENRRVTVATNGWVKVDLGQVEPLPDEALTSPFRFLSIWHDDRELPPRKQVASLAYVAAPYESGVSGDQYVARSIAEARRAAGPAPDRKERLDELVECGDFSLETRPRLPATWLEAIAVADQLGVRLPSFEEWYGAHDSACGTKLKGMAGHYEWVLPWVYEPAIHTRMHELYRGKPVACYYEELSPLNAYPFRLLQPR